MTKISYAFVLAAGILTVFSASASAQSQSPYPLADKVAAQVIAHYQNSSCQQIAEAKQHPPSPQQQKAVQLLKQNPQAAQYFISKVAAPIANKLFECGMIP
jgi:hypothetical protein